MALINKSLNEYADLESFQQSIQCLFVLFQGICFTVPNAIGGKVSQQVIIDEARYVLRNADPYPSTLIFACYVQMEPGNIPNQSFQYVP